MHASTRRPGIVLAGLALGCAVLGGCSASSTTVPTTVPTTAPAPTVLQAATAPWRLPTPVSRAVVVEDGADVLVLGGLATGDVSTAAIVRIDPSSGAATRAGSLVRAVHDAGGVVIGGRADVFGGGSFTTVGEVQAWTSEGGTQVVGSLPQPRSDLAAAVLAGTGYVVGGFDGTNMTPDILATTDGSTFHVAGHLAVPVRYPAVAVVAGALWVAGGQLGTAESSAVGGQTDDIQRFDPATGQTTVVGHLPEPLGHASALVLAGQLFVVGGRTGTTPSAQIWAVDTHSGTVRAAGSLPGPLSDAGAVSLGGTGYLIGGEVAGPLAPLDTVVVLTPSRR
jgi:hypothetical protein